MFNLAAILFYEIINTIQLYILTLKH